MKRNRFSLLIYIWFILLSVVYCPDVITGYTFKVVKDTALAKGVSYKKIIMGSGWRKHHVHVIEAEVSREDIGVRVLKAKNHIGGKEKLHAMIESHDSLYNDEILSAVNANFWSAYNNHPISHAIKNGEVIKFKNYKEWSSGFFDTDDRLFIGYFELQGYISWNDKKIRISNVNTRRDSAGVILYNKYAGKEIPFISRDKINGILEERLNDTAFSDITDIALDTAEFLREIELQEKAKATETRLYKIRLEYLSQPLINKEIKCVVNRADTGLFLMPKSGCIISFGEDTPYDHIPDKGDTLVLKFSTSIHDSLIFKSAVSGTPRLVTQGKADHKAREEGSRSRRFIRYHLPRTAVGTNKDKTILILAVVESSSRRYKRRGANLQEMAVIMKKLGCYDAMNLDGGGSSQMLIQGKNILSNAGPMDGRKISTGLGIIKIKPLRNIFKALPKRNINIKDTLPGSLDTLPDRR